MKSTRPSKLISLRLAVAVALSTATLTSLNNGTVRADSAADVSRVLKPGDKLEDSRLGKLRTTNDTFHPWTPPKTKADWDQQARAIRERILVSTGLWPMVPKEPLHPVIHGKIDKEDYTVEKVFFASLPGHYVTGNLYRPTKINGKAPGVLCPHGHWANGRLYDAGDKEAKSQIAQKAEQHEASAHFPLQARMVGLARLGCVVFHYDMIGYADSKPIRHDRGFTDAEADLRLQSACGLQTFNSIRALDFLLSLPDVDSHRIGVTGASGGGTQTFLLGAIDPRPTVAFPAVMVSTNMQGGCVCENCELLRLGINNVAIAALFAPKPLGMSGAHDWTIDIETKGLPELKQIYGLYGQADQVFAKCFPQFGHNYNQVSRETMYGWFNAHLDLGRHAPIVEADFSPIDPKDLHVFDKDHPLPADAKAAPELRAYLTDVAHKQFAELTPKDAVGLERYRDVVGTASRAMLDGAMPDPSTLKAEAAGTTATDLGDGITLIKGFVSRSDDGTKLPWVSLQPESFKGTVVVWLDGQGKSHLFGTDGKPTQPVRRLLKAGKGVVSADLFLTGEFNDSNPKAESLKVNRRYAAFTFGYNPTVLSNRVHDIVTAVAGMKKAGLAQSISLVGTGEAGPCVLLAAPFLRDQVSEVLADAHGLSYQKLPAATDPMFLPGALKYGGLGGLAALAAPTRLSVCGTAGIPADELAPLSAAYQATHSQLSLDATPLSDTDVADRLIRRVQ